MAEISLADGGWADFASSDPPNLWVNGTALEKPVEKLLEKLDPLVKSQKAVLFPVTIRGRLLREVAG